MNILIIDDEPDLGKALSEYIQISSKHQTEVHNDSGNIIPLLQKGNYDLLISDVRMPGITGIQLAEYINSEKIPTDIILISGEDDIINSINAIDAGVYDFLTKPVDMSRLSILLKEIEKKRKSVKTDFPALEKQKTIALAKISLPDDIFFTISKKEKYIIHSEKMVNIKKKTEKIAGFTDIPILIVGKTGTGKELIARMIHKISTGGNAPFIALNCAAIEKNLFESELFGYTKGAFTGADQKGNPGKIAMADGGTLFLDEITEISPDIQTKLLRVLQEKEYYQIGGTASRDVQARIVCATNKDINKLVEDGKFREDLFYRLDICKLEIPELKDRKEDIIPLGLFFIKDVIEKNNLPVSHLEGQVLQMLTENLWQGNIRQLKNTITRALLFSEDTILRESDFDITRILSKKSDTPFMPGNVHLPDDPFSLNNLVEDIIIKSLKKYNGNKTKTADFLKLDRYQFYRRYKSVVDRYMQENNDKKHI